MPMLVGSTPTDSTMNSNINEFHKHKFSFLDKDWIAKDSQGKINFRYVGGDWTFGKDKDLALVDVVGLGTALIDPLGVIRIMGEKELPCTDKNVRRLMEPLEVGQTLHCWTNEDMFCPSDFKVIEVNGNEAMVQGLGGDDLYIGQIFFEHHWYQKEFFYKNHVKIETKLYK